MSLWWFYIFGYLGVAIGVYKIIMQIRSMKSRIRSLNPPKEQYVWNGTKFVDKKEYSKGEASD